MTISTSTRMCGAETDALAVRAAGGDREALGELFEAHQGTVMGLVRRHLRGAHTADVEDAAQEVWAKVCANIGRFEPRRGGFIAWLAVLALWAAKRVYPRDRVGVGVDVAYLTGEQARAVAASPHRLVAARLALAALAGHMRALSPLQRIALVVGVLEIPGPIAAAKFGTTSGALVQARVRARRQLRELTGHREAVTA